MSSSISRRRALKTFAGAAALATLPRVAHSADAPAVAPTPNPAMPTLSTPGKLRQSVCRWCFKDTPLDELCRAARDIGLASVELLGPDEWPVALKHGLTCAMAMGPSTIPDGFNRIENHAKLVPEFRERFRAAAAVGIPNVICFSGNRRGLADELGLENCAIGIQQIVGDAERAGVTLCMELLNSRVNHKDYMCDRTSWGVELVKRVGSERFKLLYDIYHMQIMEGDVIRTIREHHAVIGHYHTAGNPGRHEFTRADDVQELNYAAIFRAIRESGYTGFIGHEFIPTREPIAALREAAELCEI
jgi:hydroxypyruvate isomerase